MANLDHTLAFQETPWEELINGNVVLMSPRPAVNHNFVAGNIYRIFSNYLHGKRCTPFPDGTDLYLTEQDRFVPDGMIVCDPGKIHHDGVHGPPDLVVEVLSPSTAKYDRNHKREIYERCGVREYWIVSPNDRTVEQYFLQNGHFVTHEVYVLHPDWFLAHLTQEERAAVVTTFQCSLYGDLDIHLEDIFYRLI